MKKYKFRTKIHAVGGGGAYVLFPYDVETEFGVKGRVPIKATFEGVPAEVSLPKVISACRRNLRKAARH